jgi:cytochrome o ubiquinol oxidase subunit II
MRLPLSCVSLARTARRLLRISGGALLGTSLTGCGSAVLDPHGPIGRQERLILIDSTAIMLAIVIPVMIATLLCAWWFRAGNPKARRQLDWAYSGRIEFIVWAIPALVIMFLGGIAWLSSHDLDPPRAIESPVAPLDVDVVSLDWKWLFIYPDAGVASVNHLVLPVGTPVRFHMTSASVMNSFFIPQLGSQVYTMAGMATRLNLLVDDPGVYHGLSAQFSGEGFSDMTFEVSALSRQDFELWLDTTRTEGGTLDANAYATLMRPSAHDPQHTFATVPAGMFDAILAHPGAAPSAAQIEHYDSAD